MREAFQDGVYVPLGPVMDALIDAALSGGPMVIEAQICPCGAEFWSIHRFQEVVQCPGCEKRFASQAQIYKDEAERAANA